VNSKQNIQHSPAEEWRARIVAAARECFRRFGFAKTSMQEIASAAGMSAANLYRFYDGKVAIGSAVARAEQSAVLAACDETVAAAGPDVAERLIAMFTAIIDVTRRRMKRTPLLFDLSVAMTRESPELRQRFLTELEECITVILSGRSAGQLTGSAAVRVRSRMILMACAPFILPWMLLNEPFGDPRPMIEPLVRQLLSGMGNGRSDPTLAVSPVSP
jgi:AcrR family transcriptional regulator